MVDDGDLSWGDVEGRTNTGHQNKEDGYPLGRVVRVLAWYGVELEDAVCANWDSQWWYVYMCAWEYDKGVRFAGSKIRSERVRFVRCLLRSK